MQRTRRAGFTLIELMIVIAIIAIIAAIAIPSLMEARKNGNETSAIAALKAIYTAQIMYRESDRDGDGDSDFGSLSELGTHGFLLDDVLSTGTKSGYTFITGAGSDDRTSLMYAVANPARLGTTGDRAFATTIRGAILYTSALIPIGPPFTDEGKPPASLIPLR